MKWNEFLQNQNTVGQAYSPMSRMTKNINTSKDSGRGFQLKSVSKDKHNVSMQRRSVMKRSAFDSRANHKQQLKLDISIEASILQKEKKPQSSLKSAERPLLPNQLYNIQQQLSSLKQQMRLCLKKHFQGAQHTSKRKYYQLQFARRCDRALRELVSQFTNIAPIQSPNKVRFAQNAEGQSAGLNGSLLHMLDQQMANKSQHKAVNRILQFKNDKVTELNTRKLQDNQKQVQMVLQKSQKPLRQAKFARTSRTQLRRKKSQNSSIDSIEQSQVSGSRRTNTSRLKSKQALSRLSRAIHQ